MNLNAGSADRGALIGDGAVANHDARDAVHPLARLASLRLTLAVLLALGAGILVSYDAETASVWWIAAPLSIGAVNLGAAIVFNQRFRRQTPLLAFHIALLALVVLFACGRLSYFRGQVELAEGESFAGEMAQIANVRQGPLHVGNLGNVKFVNDGFSIRYAPGLRRAETQNRVRVGPALDSRVIGDIDPLIAEGYRFYTSFNKGFALMFTWIPADGSLPVRGAVHLPSYPIHEFEQAMEWTPPGMREPIWCLLRFDKPPLDETREAFFQKPAADVRHDVVLRAGTVRHELTVGQSQPFAEGVLRYDGLSTWMGYEVFYDWTIPWLLAACLMAVLCLAWHFARAFRANPWDAPSP